MKERMVIVVTWLILYLLLGGCKSVDSKRAFPEQAFMSITEDIVDWKRGKDNSEIYIQDDNHQWYKALFWGPCLNLRPAQRGINFLRDSMGRIDRTSAIVVDGERCDFRSLELAPDPTVEPEVSKVSE